MVKKKKKIDEVLEEVDKTLEKTDKVLKEGLDIPEIIPPIKVVEKEYVPGWDPEEDRKHKRVSA